MAEEEQMNETFTPDPHLNPLPGRERKTQSGR
jgi:hypothetical protein